MRKLFFTLLLLFPFLLLAQNDTIIINNNYKWKIGVKGMFEKTGYPQLTTDLNEYFNFGFQGIYKIGIYKSSIESGIYSSSRGFNSIFKGTYYSYLNEITYKNIQIPIRFRFDTRLFYFSAGFYYNYNYATEADNINDFEKSGIDIKKNTFGYAFTMGIEKEFLSKMSFFLEIGIQYDAISIEDDLKLQNNGIAIGINYKL